MLLYEAGQLEPAVLEGVLCRETDADAIAALHQLELARAKRIP
jgi:hypothetical protein